MRDRKDYDILMVSKTLSPMTHNSGTAGNETILNTETVMQNGTPVQVPMLSGNAIRHSCVRGPGAMYLVEALGLRRRIGLDALNMLFSGGSLYKSGATENVGRIREMWDLFPLIKLLGCSLPDTIVGGIMLAWRGLCVCNENRERLGAVLPDGWLPATQLVGAAELVHKYQYTRQDASKQHADDLSTAPGGRSTQMIYGGQALRAGTVFVHGFALRSATVLEVGALAVSLGLWESQGATLGGMASKGHGRVATSYHATPDIDWASAAGAYMDHVQRHRDEQLQWLDTMYGLEEVPNGDAD